MKTTLNHFTHCCESPCYIAVIFQLYSYESLYCRLHLHRWRRKQYENGGGSWRAQEREPIRGSGAEVQGSVLGPLLFVLYAADVTAIAIIHSIRVHTYADDTRLLHFLFWGASTVWGIMSNGVTYRAHFNYHSIVPCIGLTSN